jgi:hypothetical protein
MLRFEIISDERSGFAFPLKIFILSRDIGCAFIDVGCNYTNKLRS